MTVIVYDGKSIAADRQLTAGSIIVGYVCKIRKWSKGVFAIAGSDSDAAKFEQYLKDGVKFKPSKGFNAIVTKGKKVFCVWPDFDWGPAYVPWGIGAGGDEAETLCRAGFTAEEAIRQVCKYNIHCGGKVDVVEV